MQHWHELPCASRRFQGWDDQREVRELEVMEDGEVAMVDGVFEGAFGARGDKTWFEMEALEDSLKNRGFDNG
ncbi:hypothetical protein Tco_0613395 [Tanacetum coccineum]